MCDLISSKLDAVLTAIDGERFSGDSRELGATHTKNGLVSCINLFAHQLSIIPPGQSMLELLEIPKLG